MARKLLATPRRHHRLLAGEKKMTGLACFQTSICGMSGQSHALDVIGANIANATTGGYKRPETSFQTVLSETVAFHPGNPDAPGPASIQSDLGGIKPYDNARISQPGEYATTGRDLDIAISGRGFFVLNGQPDGSGATMYGRDGQLSVATVTGAGGAAVAGGTQGYLVDKNGYFLQGWPAAADGSFATGGAPASMRVDADAFTSLGAPTTAATLAMNLPADDSVGATETYTIDVFDSAAKQHPIQLSFTKQAANTWSLAAGGGPGATVTITPDSGLIFDGTGQPTSSGTYNVAATFADDPANPTAAALTLDVGGFTQFADGAQVYDYQRDGYAPGALSSVTFNERGEVIGQFDNGRTRPLYRLALADFVDPDGLMQLSGNVYEESLASGRPVVAGAGEAGLGEISPQTLEKSNVDLAREFTRMMLTQNAYNSSATAFRTIDEMTEVARDLAR
jgi:flagellar hook protein FlgE